MKLENKILKLSDWAIVFTISLILFSVFILLRRPIEPVADQLFATYRLSSGYPRFSDGISSLLIAGIINLFHPVSSTISSLIVRIVSAVLFMSSASILSWNIFTRYNIRWAFFPCLVIIFGSGLPFLWLSSELLAGAFLMFAFWSYLSNRNFIFTSLFLTFYCLAKPDCIFSGVLLGLFMSIKSKQFVTFTLVLFLFLLPGIIASHNYTRGAMSFGQHYALLMHEGSPKTTPKNPWLSWEQYVIPAFGTTKLSKIVTEYPRKYGNFIYLSANKSLRNMIISGILFLIIITVWGLLKIKTPEFKLTVLVLFTSLIPIILFSFCHIRYLARFYPLLVITSLIVAVKSNRTIRTAVSLFLIILFIVQLHHLIPVLLSASYFGGGIWLTGIFGVDY